MSVPVWARLFRSVSEQIPPRSEMHGIYVHLPRHPNVMTKQALAVLVRLAGSAHRPSLHDVHLIVDDNERGPYGSSKPVINERQLLDLLMSPAADDGTRTQLEAITANVFPKLKPA